MKRTESNIVFFFFFFNFAAKIIPEIPITVKFDIKNTCKVAFYYSWELGITPEIMFRNSYTITVSQKQGHLTSENQCSCYLTLTTFQKIHIKNHCVLLKVRILYGR